MNFSALQFCKPAPSGIKNVMNKRTLTKFNRFNKHGNCSCLMCLSSLGSALQTKKISENLIDFDYNKSIKRNYAFQSESDDSTHISDLLENNKKWASSLGQEYFGKLGQPQKPKYLYFGCSDSRVPANQIVGLG